VSLAQTLSESIQGKSVLLVASTDLSHFHSYEEAKKLDRRIMDRVAVMDAEGIYADIAFGLGEACGSGPMMTALLAAKQLGADQSEVLFAANSGDVTGDRSRVVGYMAAALWASAKKKIDSSVNNVMASDRIGLNKGSWEDPKTEIFVFSAEIF
jgi:AmmeMemoRadiSam system protein B